jgi:serine/threonine protein kinase
MDDEYLLKFVIDDLDGKFWELGSGSYGTVVSGFDTKDKKYYAIKAIYAPEGNSKMQEQVSKEIQILNILNSNDPGDKK